MTVHRTALAEVEDWHFWCVGRDELVLALLDRFAPAGVLVDAGCGTGSFAARLLALRKVPVVALDRSRPTRTGAAVAAIGDVERLPLRDRSVAVVLARDVLEHVDDAAALAECRRVLRPDGVLIALVPAWPGLWSERDVNAGHLRRYTRQSLRTAAAAAGFREEELRGYQLALLPAMALSRAASRRRPAVLRAENHPSPRVNAALGAINLAEARLARSRWLRPPVGSTLALVARPR